MDEQTKLRDEFIKDFGIDTWLKLQEAVKSHIDDGLIDKEFKGNFAQVIFLAIGFECVEKSEYRQYHGISITWDEFKSWLLSHRDRILRMRITDNDIDYLAFSVGKYDFLRDGGEDRCAEIK